MRSVPASRLAAASMLLLLAACTDDPAPVPVPTPPGPTASAASCPAGVTLTAGQVETAMGLRAMRVEMVNCGARPYAVNSYPALRVLDADQKPLEVTVAQGTAQISRIEGFDGPPRPVTLDAGDRAAAVVVWRNTVTDATMPATTGTHLEMAPAPGQPVHLLSPVGGIDVGTTGTIATSPWVAAA